MVSRNAYKLTPSVTQTSFVSSMHNSGGSYWIISENIKFDICEKLLDMGYGFSILREDIKFPWILVYTKKLRNEDFVICSFDCILFILSLCHWVRTYRGYGCLYHSFIVFFLF